MSVGVKDSTKEPDRTRSDATHIPRRLRVDHKGYRKKKELLQAKGYLIVDIERYGLNRTIIDGVYNDEISLKDLERFGVDFEECVKASPPRIRHYFGF